MKNQILAMIIYPHRKIPVFQPIKRNTETFTSIIGETPENVEINNKFTVICGRNAVNNGKERNITITDTGENIYGTAIICKTDGKGFGSMSFRETYEVDKLYKKFWGAIWKNIIKKARISANRIPNYIIAFHSRKVKGKSKSLWGSGKHS